MKIGVLCTYLDMTEYYNIIMVYTGFNPPLIQNWLYPKHLVGKNLQRDLDRCTRQNTQLYESSKLTQVDELGKGVWILKNVYYEDFESGTDPEFLELVQNYKKNPKKVIDETWFLFDHDGLRDEHLIDIHDLSESDCETLKTIDIRETYCMSYA